MEKIGLSIFFLLGSFRSFHMQRKISEQIDIFNFKEKTNEYMKENEWAYTAEISFANELNEEKTTD